METGIKLPNISPEINANPLSKLFFCWILPFLKYGSNHTIQNRDIYDTIDEDCANRLTGDLERNWNFVLKKSRIKNRKASMKKSLLYTFGHSFIIYGLYLLIQSVIIRILHPIVLAEYIKHFTEKNADRDERIGYYFAAAIIILAFFNNLIFHHCFIGCSRIGIKAKTACACLIQKKVLRLSQYSLNRTSPSRVVKLLSEDVKKIELVSPYLHYLYITPVQFLTSMYVLFHIIGISSLTGLFFMVFISIPQDYISTVHKEILRQLSIFTDARMKIMKEILYGIRTIKMYGWEKPFEEIITKTREHEVNIVSKNIFIKCFSLSTLVFTQTIAIFFTLTTYVLLGNELKAEIAFSVCLIFYNLQQYTNYLLPEAIERYLEVNSAISRIENFLTLEEKEEQIKVISYKKGVRKPGSIKITEASAKWGIQPVLQNITLTINSGSCCCIFGPSASGKTSFIQMILKELSAITGRVDVIGSVSYASQKPWLFPSTVKNNILFGQPYNRHKYREILKICSLENDLKKLPYGDRTLIGDKLIDDNGIKEKINLARTFYKDADIYIIDDSFGFMDYQTEKFIFSECVKKYLNTKTRIFVTNKLYYAKEADKIVVLENGSINRIIESEDFTEADFQYLNSKLSIEKNNFTPPSLTNFIEETEINGNDIDNNNLDNKQGYFVTFGQLFKLSGKKSMIEIVIILVLITQLFANLSDYWLSQWVQQNISKPDNNNNTNNNTSTFNIIFHKIYHDVIHGLNITNENIENNLVKKDFYICYYAGFIIICIIITVIRSLLYHTICMNALRALHKIIFDKVLFSPMKFFETFPSGKILQRFSMDVIYNVPIKNFITWQMYAAICGSTVLILFAAPVIILPLLLITIMIYFLTCAFISTIRDLQNLQNNAQYPIKNFLITIFNGVFTIRSCVGEEVMSEIFESLIDKHTGISIIVLIISEYFCFYMDLLALLFMAITTFLVVLIKIDTSHYNGYVGLAVTQGIILTELLHLGIRESIDVIRSNTAIDRTLQYTKLQTENVENCTIVPRNWPYCGKITFKNVYIKKGKNLNISIKPSEKIAVVSRYPEEKFTILNCLLRLLPVEGLVTIDDVDTSLISLNKLRSNITVITKDPLLFSASLRFNLDPLECANDEMMWRVLEDVGLKTSVQSLSQPIIEGGLNFSSGQRQLLCLARALLRNTKVLIIENNPTNIDSSTDGLIRKIIKEKFKNCTIITVANTLTTIMENEKILVIENGKEVEYAHAHELLKNPDGLFSQLVRETGQSMEENLRKIAKENFESNNLNIHFQFE